MHGNLLIPHLFQTCTTPNVNRLLHAEMCQNSINKMEKLYTLQQLQQAFEDGILYDADELEIPTGDAHSDFEAWMNFRHPEDGYQELKTSVEWQKLWDYIVLDPDGWDRQDYQYSWFEEEITWGEFNRRAFSSTCISNWEQKRKDDGKK